MKPHRFVGWMGLLFSVIVLAACNKGQESGPKGNDSRFLDGKTYGKYKLYATKYDQSDAKKCKDNAADVLTQLQNESNICLVGLWAYNPPALREAVKEAQKVGKVRIVGFDENDETL